jgi:hypothetical protein
MSAQCNSAQTVLLVQLNDFCQNFAVEALARFKSRPPLRGSVPIKGGRKPCGRESNVNSPFLSAASNIPIK